MSTVMVLQYLQAHYTDNPLCGTKPYDTMISGPNKLACESQARYWRKENNQWLIKESSSVDVGVRLKL